MATMVLRPAPSESQLPTRFSVSGSEIVRGPISFREVAYDADSIKDEDNFVLRHGFEEDHMSEEYLTALADRFWMYYTDKRHETGGRPQAESQKHVVSDWRQRDRCKTIVAALMLCLNIGVDPPDIIKTSPTAKLECWIDPGPPQNSGNTKIMETIGKALQTQYETLSIRTRYKQWLDPSIEDTKKCCVSLRRNAREERVLFHYNGHGVPLPTMSGEVWYFNRNYTQYIPVSLYDLQLWLGSPTIYVFDVSHAGNVVENFERFIIKHNAENEETRRNDPNAPLQNYSDNIILAACGEKENLPTNPDLPADLFTCCLTSPVMIALRCFVMNSELPLDLSLKDVEKIPGRLQERRTPLGELNWIFTAITDTIAWNALPTPLFKKLFRQDLMVAALFRNHLLAERLMRAYGCHPQTLPALPPTHNHPLWQAWDLAIEMVISQLPALIQAEESNTHYEFQHSIFFAEQLTAFDVYLSQGAPHQKVPGQLPIVLQVLLSQAHRLRALVLLSRFLDLGPWAVDLALNIGIFPYVLKLLQSLAPELKPVMIFIWTRLLAVDQSCQTDLIRDSGYKYFLAALQPGIDFPVKNASEHRAMSTFIISMFCRGFQQGRAVSMTPELFQACKENMQDQENPLLRQWSCLCISILWQDYPEAKWMGISVEAHLYLTEMSFDPVPEVRAAALHALSNFIGIPDLSPQVMNIEEAIALSIMSMTLDGNSMVRVELLVFFSVYVKRYLQKFLVAAFEELVELRQKLKKPDEGTDQNKTSNSSSLNSTSADASISNGPSTSQGRETRSISENSVPGAMWKHLWIMSVDPHPEVAEKAAIVVDYVHTKLLESPLRAHAKDVMDDLQLLGKHQKQAAPKSKSQNPASNRNQTPPISEAPSIPKSESYLSMGLRRTFSTVRSMTLGAPATPSPQVSPPREQAPINGRATRKAIQQRRLPTEWTRPPDAQDPQSSAATYQRVKTPTPRGFKPASTSPPPSIPLQSGFLDWCIEYFREPQMKPNEYEEPGSDEYNSRLWRRSRNEKTLNETQPQKIHAGVSRWDIPDGSFNNGLQPTKMCFHQFEDHLVVADDRDTICVWNWEQNKRIGRFGNGNPNGSRISEMRFINEDDQALLLTGSTDGVIKLFRDYDSEKNVSLISAFRGVSDVLPSTRNAGLVVDWQQGQGKLLVAGDMKVVKIWNAATEVCVSEIPSRSGSCVTSLTSDQVAGNVFVAGYGDGAVRVFDQRKRPVTAMTKSWRQHKQWIVNVHMQRGGMRELVSGSRSGEVKLWDLRMDTPLRTILATKDTLRILSVHEHAPVFATGSDRHNINFFNVNSAFLNSIDVSSRFLHIQQHRSPVASMVFHPHKMMLAYSTLNDNHINLTTCIHRSKGAPEASTL